MLTTKSTRRVQTIVIPEGNIRLICEFYKDSNDFDDPDQTELMEIEADGQVFRERTWPDALAAKYGTWEELEADINFGN